MHKDTHINSIHTHIKSSHACLFLKLAQTIWTTKLCTSPSIATRHFIVEAPGRGRIAQPHFDQELCTTQTWCAVWKRPKQTPLISVMKHIPILQTSAFWIESTKLIQQALASESCHHLHPPVNIFVSFRKTRTSTWSHVHTTINFFS